MRKEPKREILVNRQILARNKKLGEQNPVISVQRSGHRVQYAHTVDILDAAGNTVASVIYNPDKPRKCGATVWIEARAGVKLHEVSPAVTCDPNEFGDESPLLDLPFTRPADES